MLTNILQKINQQLQGESLSIAYSHIVAPKTPLYYYESIPPKAFQTQIQFFKKHYNIIGLHEALTKVHHNESLKNHLVLTFDDGYKSCYDYIAPILVEENATATFFLNTATLDNQHLMWRNQLLYIKNTVPTKRLKQAFKQFNHKLQTNLTTSNFLKKSQQWAYANQENWTQTLWQFCNLPSLSEFLNTYQPYLTTPQVNELLNAHFSIGGHTHSHPNCSLLNSVELEKEILDTNRILAEKFEVNILAFAYPFGYRNTQQSFSLCELGVMESFKNYNNPKTWERFKLEKNLNRTLLNRGGIGLYNNKT